jgi:hypothetical protein
MDIVVVEVVEVVEVKVQDLLVVQVEKVEMDIFNLYYMLLVMLYKNNLIFKN